MLERLPWWVLPLTSFGFGLVISLAGPLFPKGLTGAAIIVGILCMLIGGVAGIMHFREELGCALTAIAVGIAVALAVYSSAFFWQKVTEPPDTAPAPAANRTTPEPILNAHWRGDSVVGTTLFFRTLLCGVDGVEVVSKYLIPSDADIQTPTSDRAPDMPNCRIMHAASIGLTQPKRLFILVIAHQESGKPSTLQTSAFFFEVGPDTEMQRNLEPVARERYPGDRIADFRAKELDYHFAAAINGMKMTLPEMSGGGPVQMTAASHSKAFIFDPIERTVAFCAKQGAKVSSLSTDLNPNWAGGHRIELNWNNEEQTISLAVDGETVRPQAASYADDRCMRTIRPPLRSDDLRHAS